MARVHVVARSADPLTLAGLTSQLAAQPRVQVSTGHHTAETEVLVVGADRLTPELVAELRAAAAEFDTPVVLVADGVTEADLLAAVECRVVAVLPRASATGSRLAHAVLAAADGGGVLGPDLVGGLLKHLDRVQRELLAPRGLTASGLTTREIDVLRLMADGHDTAEIGIRLSYSERMIKNVIHGLTRRLNLRNRSHAVAFALRAGVI
ncbi:helix-turn-helix transcriptional regulator [Actinokineospora globicatena]|uniref:Helix-turn-helix transcriptional regulator n=1 Tax=Actinokineospora globicatena TaxID=103729 RepID=A0A9W6V633_9PSEU|nr:response regulator transcription factor [Actinokineospora globicatena]MCP2303490.1 DNA-binding response regulator, NarL/FixJ family, contains REC and HTH domains [Actinokineospora globicatena]GLW79376.1 helix-turn-helix transcriptional regulator [Actinokineospora globicatena]GLW86214.1 helix-turn-helix transcriptional regulator [Actinokineospora globicatena]GLW90002.1 helix-turn-helix transcriptional regulator [Actinokineospora globicatena]